MTRGAPLEGDWVVVWNGKDSLLPAYDSRAPEWVDPAPKRVWSETDAIRKRTWKREQRKRWRLRRALAGLDGPLPDARKGPYWRCRGCRKRVPRSGMRCAMCRERAA